MKMKMILINMNSCYSTCKKWKKKFRSNVHSRVIDKKSESEKLSKSNIHGYLGNSYLRIQMDCNIS